MAIGTTTDGVDKFGTKALVTIASPSSVAISQYSATADAAVWTNSDSAVFAAMLGEFTFATAPAVGGTVDLYGRLMNIDGTNDAVVPGAGATAGNSHVYLGTFPVDDVTTIQFIPIEIGLPNMKLGQEYEFYIRNNASFAISAAWQLHITPKAIGPTA